MPTQRLQMLFCERFHCPAAEYEHRMFRKSLYWHARLLAPLLPSLKADFFALDLQFVRYLGESTGPREVVVDLLNFRDANLGRGNFWRTALKLRVSGRKAGRLAQELFAEYSKTNPGMLAGPATASRKNSSRPQLRPSEKT